MFIFYQSDIQLTNRVYVVFRMSRINGIYPPAACTCIRNSCIHAPEKSSPTTQTTECYALAVPISGRQYTQMPVSDTRIAHLRDITSEYCELKL